MTDKYILDGHETVPEPDLMKWAEWLEGADRIVAKFDDGNIRVSTVFLGLDHSFGNDGPPVLFETMVFGGEYDGEQERYGTWVEAEAGHARWVTRVKKETKAETGSLKASAKPAA